MKYALLGLALAAAFAVPSEAAVITRVDNVPGAWTDAFSSAPSSLSTGGGAWAVGGDPSIRLGNDPSVYRSPFDDSGNGTPIAADWDTNLTYQYYAVGPDNPNNPATLNFTKDQNAFSFLWGSVDSYNSLAFFLDGAVNPVLTVLWSDFVGEQEGIGASFITITNLVFDQIVFTSTGSNAFEFSNISATPVPLPASVLLLFSGLGGLGLLTRLRSRARGKAGELAPLAA